ncbi:MAG: hypothetical protein AMXMBFR4_09770 [Candidatus Hydrogenedentota bacterium]
MRPGTFFTSLAPLRLAVSVFALEPGPQWTALFDGESLEGWHISETCEHGDTRGWSVVDGTIEGTQDKTGNGESYLPTETTATSFSRSK